MRLQLKIKSNGHQVCTKLIRKQSLLGQLIHYIQKYKFPMNINVNEIRSVQQDLLLNDRKLSSSTHQQKQMKINNNQMMRRQSILQSQDQYDISVLSEQVILFQSDKQIQDYIATQKLLAHDVEEKLTKLSKALILVANQQFQKKRQMLSFTQISEKIQDKNITKQQLNQIQQKCMQTLSKVQEQRKKLQLCVICWQNLSNIIIMPCMHLVMCSKCQKIRSCPVCKTPVQNFAQVYR